MIGNYSARMTGSKRTLLALLASSVVFSAGCSNMSSTAPAVKLSQLARQPSAEKFMAEISLSSAQRSPFGSLVKACAPPQSKPPPPQPTAQVPSASPKHGR